MVLSQSDFDVGNVVKARNRLWRVERTLSHKSEYVENTKIPLLQVHSIDGVPSQCCLFPTLEEIIPAEIPKPDITRLGNPEFQKVLIQALRFNLIFGTSSFISLANSRVIPVSYQMVPVFMALAQENVRLLIADDVGLGKTIEAGLIIQELLGRKKISRILFVVPASLQDQWNESMQQFFGLDTKILSRQTRRKLEKELLVGGDPWGYFNYIITSQDYLARPEILERVIQFDFDLIVIDEAHNVAKPRYLERSKNTRKMKRSYVMSEKLANYSHLIMLTATPHNGYHESFVSLLNLLKTDIVDASTLEIHKEKGKRHICQRRKADVIEWMEESEDRRLFPEDDRKEEFFTPSGEYKKIFTLIDKYAEAVLGRAKEDTEGVRFIRFWGLLHMYKRFISSPHALIRTIDNKLSDVQSDTGLRDPNQINTDEQEQLLEKTRRNITDTNQGEEYEEHEMDRKNDSELGKKQIEPEIKELLLKIRDLCVNLKGTPHDVRLDHLAVRVLPELVRKSSKIIIFSRYIDTVQYLADELKKEANRKRTLQGFEIITIIGTDPIQARMEKYQGFLKLSKGILISTDCMSEGIDLHYSSNVVINYELTWNPNRLEQRNGRVSRFGQPEEEVFLRTLIMRNSLEIAILDLLYKKVKTIATDFGHLPHYFGNLDLVGDMIGEYYQSKRSLKGTLLPFLFGDNSDVMQEMLKKFYNPEAIDIVAADSFYGQTVVDLTDIEQRMKEVEESIGKMENLLTFMQKALPFFGSKIETVNKLGMPTNKVFKINVSEELERLIVGGGKEFFVTTDPVYGSKNANVETLSLKSPVLNAVVNLVSERGFIAQDTFYGRTSAVTSDSTEEDIAILYYRIRYLVKTKTTTVMEEIVPIGIKIFDEPIDRGGKPLVENREVEKIWNEFINGKTSNYPGTTSMVEDVMRELYSREDYEKLVHSALEKRLYNVKQHVKSVMENLKVKNLSTAEELEGMDEIVIISQDPISVTIFYPPGGN